MKIENKSKSLFSMLALIFLLASGPAPAAPTDQTKVDSTSEAIPTTAGLDKGVFLNAGPGMALLSGNTGWALNVGALTQVQENSPIFIGADLGLDFWNNTSVNGASASTGATGLQLLPTAIYRFNIAGARNIYPYAGVSMGPHIYFQRDVVANNVVITQGTTNVYFELLFRPGIFLGITDSIALNLEPKFGLLKDMFIFLPNVNAVFRL
jgi:hypothetical protein